MSGPRGKAAAWRGGGGEGRPGAPHDGGEAGRLSITPPSPVTPPGNISTYIYLTTKLLRRPSGRHWGSEFQKLYCKINRVAYWNPDDAYLALPEAALGVVMQSAGVEGGAGRRPSECVSD